MGAFIARQPNGLLCRFSTVVDTITHYNMTDEDYIELCAERAREEARRNLTDNKAWFIRSFEDVKAYFRPLNDTSEQFLSYLREMGDTETSLEDLIEE